MIKMINSIIIVFCSTILGIYTANKYVSRVRELRALQMAFTQLETEMMYYCTFFPEALKNISRNLPEQLKSFFDIIVKNLIAEPGCMIQNAWKNALDNSKQKLHLSEDDYDILYAFGNHIATSDKESQHRYFELIQIQLKQQEKKAQQECDKYSKMYRNLGILVGLAIVIVLL